MVRYLKDVVTLAYQVDKCVGCGRCAEVCPHGVFAMSDGRARITDRDLCMECGACARNCPAEAISVESGVGCATGIIYGALGIARDCCCSGKPVEGGGSCGAGPAEDGDDCAKGRCG